MIGNALEKLILDGEAQMKVASIGYGALQALDIAKGKSAIITEISIQPFSNIITDDQRFADLLTFATPVAQRLDTILKRATYQLLMYNSRGINNRWTLRADLELNCVADPTTLSAQATLPTIKFNERKIDTYVLIEQLTWFYFLFPTYDLFDPQFNQAPLNTIFQNINQFPPAPFGFGAQETIEFYANLPGPTFYSPLGLQDDINVGPTTTPVLNFQNSTTDSTLVLPTFPGTLGFTTMETYWDPSFPILNITYYEINKRTTTSGIS
jgi:hypothetical protein